MKVFPVVNSVLIVLNVLAFLAINTGPRAETVLLAQAYYPLKPSLLSVLTASFLHAGLGHLLGNLIFLNIVGRSVEDKLGHLGYLVFYLTAGVVACLFHGWTSDRPMIGASGAIAGVMGAYVLLFPKSKIRCFWLLFPFFKKFEVYSWLALGLWFAFNVFDHVNNPESGVAYAAHVGGFVLGGVATGLLSLMNWVRPDWVPESEKSENSATKPGPSSPDLEELFENARSQGVPCPCCLVVLSSNPFESHTLFSCRQCGGLWLTKAAVQNLLAKPDLPYSLRKPAARGEVAPRCSAGERRCSSCRRGLTRVLIGGIELESCDPCLNLWLERGKLGDLKEMLEKNHDD